MTSFWYDFSTKKEYIIIKHAFLETSGNSGEALGERGVLNYIPRGIGELKMAGTSRNGVLVVPRGIPSHIHKMCKNIFKNIITTLIHGHICENELQCPYFLYSVHWKPLE